MHRIVAGTLALLLALPALGAEDKPLTPREQYQALLKENADAMKVFQEAYQKAESAEDKSKVIQEKYPQPDKLVPRFLELAEKNPKDPAALDALIWVMSSSRSSGGTNNPQARAVELLLRDFVQSDKLGRACQGLSNGFDQEGTAFLRAVLEKNPHKEVQAEACLALAQRLSTQMMMIARLKEDAELSQRYEAVFGKEQLEQLRKMDVVKVGAESERLFKELAEKYAAAVKPERLAELCQSLVYNGNNGDVALLRALLEKDARPEVQGAACLALGQLLKKLGDDKAASDPKAADAARRESEQLLERAVAKYADVKFARGGTIGKKAASELFDLRHLAIGQTAPDVAGQDQDGKKFKLSDYRGKVVLLDFWSQF